MYELYINTYVVSMQAEEQVAKNSDTHHTRAYEIRAHISTNSTCFEQPGTCNRVDESKDFDGTHILIMYVYIYHFRIS